MWYFIVGGILVLLLFKYNKRNLKAEMKPQLEGNIADWEEIKKQKAGKLKKIKSEFRVPKDNTSAIYTGANALSEYIVNHGYSFKEMESRLIALNLPDDVVKKEAVLRRELNRAYKERENIAEKVFAIVLAFEQVKIQLENTGVDWKNFSGIQRLQSNWNAEEYFEGLLSLMHRIFLSFPSNKVSTKIEKDIERLFRLWNSRNIAQEAYKKNVVSYQNAIRASDKHFIILSIVEYLDRRYKFNPSFKDELMDWCSKDVELYEQFLKEFHEHKILTIDEQMEFYNNPLMKQKKMNAVPFDKVKQMTGYMVPRLNSFDVLRGIYEKDDEVTELAKLLAIGKRIGYVKGSVNASEPSGLDKPLDLSDISSVIEVQRSGDKGKLAFLDSDGKPCSTEEAFSDHFRRLGWSVIRAEVSFWQALFCLSFWDEIFVGMQQPVHGSDIPIDLFQGAEFYLNRKDLIDLKFEQIKICDLNTFIYAQISKINGAWTRLLNETYTGSIEYIQSQEIQSFLSTIPSEVFAEIVFRIAKNPSENRAGVSDFVVWKGSVLRFVEVKKMREKIRPSQESWLQWMLSKGLRGEVVRVKGI